MGFFLMISALRNAFIWILEVIQVVIPVTLSTQQRSSMCHPLVDRNWGLWYVRIVECNVGEWSDIWTPWYFLFLSLVILQRVGPVLVKQLCTLKLNRNTNTVPKIVMTHDQAILSEICVTVVKKIPDSYMPRLRWPSKTSCGTFFLMHYYRPLPFSFWNAIRKLRFRNHGSTTWVLHGYFLECFSSLLWTFSCSWHNSPGRGPISLIG